MSKTADYGEANPGDNPEVLISKGRFREAAELLESNDKKSILDRIFGTLVELELGDPEIARRKATSLLRQARDPRARAYCFLAAGRALHRSGSPEESLGLIRSALALAKDVDEVLHAQFLVQYVSCSFLLGVEAAFANLAELRDCSFRLGYRPALVEYYIARARIAALRHDWLTARQSIQRATELSDDEGSGFDQTWRLNEARAHIALMDGDVSTAREIYERHLDLAKKEGIRSRRAYTLGNLAHLSAIAGEFAAAREMISECQSELAPLNRIRLATCSTLIQVALGTSDFRLAAEAAAHGEAFVKATGGESTYYRRWFQLRLLQWFVATNQLVLLCQIGASISIAD